MDRIDQAFLQYLITFQGSAFDGFAAFLASDDLAKGGFLIAVLCWFWSTPSADQVRRRELVVACIVGALLAAAMSRGMTKLVDWHLRPLSTPEWGALLPASGGWEDKGGSFASDHASLAFGLVTGAFLLSRWTGGLLAVYVLAFVCFPRLYLGIHWLSDVIGGVLFGIVATGVLSLERVRASLARPVLRLHAALPGAFSIVAVFVLWGLLTRFDDVRKILGQLAGWLRG